MERALAQVPVAGEGLPSARRPVRGPRPTLLTELADWVTHDGGDPVRITTTLGRTLAVAGRLEDGHRLLRTAIDSARADAPPEVVVEAVEWCSRTLRLLGRYAAAYEVVQARLARCPSPDRERDGGALNGLYLELSTVALATGLGGPAWEARSASCPTLADPATRIQSLCQGALRLLALRRADEALALVRTAQRSASVLSCDPSRRLETLYWLAEAERSLGLDDDAAGHFTQALRLGDDCGYAYSHPYLEVGLGRVHLRRGDVHRAAACAQRAEAAADGMASAPMLAAALALTSQVRLVAGDAVAALEAAERAVQLSDPLRDNWSRHARRCLEVARNAAGVTSFRQPLVLVEPEAPQEPEQEPAPVPAGLPRQAAPVGGGLLNTLSAREREIAALVSAGRTNQQIATALVLSPKTVETYLARIFKKLDITSRSSIAHLVGLAGATA